MNHARWSPPALLFAGIAAAQSPPAGDQTPAPPPPHPQEIKLEDLPPPQRLGAKATLLREAVPVVPVLVLVPNVRSYIEAIAAWTPGGRYPVLIDDGSRDAAEDIGRFSRAFKPAKVVR